MAQHAKSKVGDKIRVERVTITPDEARHLLAEFSDPHKRPVRPRVVERYARDMAAGAWKFNGEAIMRNGNGELRNGHHRLAACIEANTPFETLMVHGLDDDVLPTIDTGTPRTAGDLLHWLEIPNPNDVGALAMWGVRYDRMVEENRWRLVSTGEVPRQELLQWVQDNPQSVESVGWILQEIGAGFGIPRSVITFTHFLLARYKTPADANHFFQDALSGAGTAESAIGRWRSWVANASMRGRGTKPGPVVCAAITIKSMRYWLLGQNPTQLRWRSATSQRTGLAVEAFPRIDGSKPHVETDYEITPGYRITGEYMLPGDSTIARIRRSMLARKSPWVVSEIVAAAHSSPESVRAVLQMYLNQGLVVATTKKLRGRGQAISYIAADQLIEED